MDALQIISSATQIITAMIDAISALDQASINLTEAPRKIQTLEEFVANLESLMHKTKMRNLHKLHNPQLEQQLQSLSALIKRLHINLSKCRKVVTKNKAKGFTKLVWSSMVGDPLSKYIQLIRDDLNWWIELQNITATIGKVITSTAESQSSLLRVRAEKGYPVSRNCHFIRELLGREDTHRVILIVGLSGIGKSCLARQIASDPPGNFSDGAIEINFGRWCSRAACNGSIAEYHSRLSKRINHFLVQIGCAKRGREVGGDLEDVCLSLQTAMVGKSMLVLLDDVWEQDIVDRFAWLYDNECRYLVTTRDEAVYEITEAEKVEICKDDIKEISKEILLHHTLLSEEELPSAAATLLDRCGHHPLTVAVMGKALRKEKHAEKWEKAILNLSTYATCAPGPISYVNEKEAAETTLTIFGSFEFSLEVMPENSRQFFILLSSLSWAEPVPESCLEALWSVLGPDCMFPLVVSKLVEGSLLIKLEQQLLYHVHDMVSLYLDVKKKSAVSTIFVDASLENIAFIALWLFIFGEQSVQDMAEEKIESFLMKLRNKEVVILLESMVQALMASKSISELETSRLGFSRILSPVIYELISSGSQELLTAAAKSITTVFMPGDYATLAKSLETNSVGKLLNFLELCEKSEFLIAVSLVVAKLAVHFSAPTVDNILTCIPMDRLSELLSPETEEFHESVFTILLSLAEAGKLLAIETMFRSGIDKRLLVLLVKGSDVAQNNAIITLKAFNELGVRLDQGCFQPGELNLLPWNARLSLERFVFSNSRIDIPSPIPQTFKVLLHKILDKDGKEVVEAIQGLIPIAEKVSDPRTRDLILGSGLIERLGFLLQLGEIDQTQVQSESAFLIMKLACTGGDPFVQKFIQLDMVSTLIKMMQCNIKELQDSAYTALHQIVFAKGGSKVLTKFLQTGQIERLVRLLDRKCIKTKEVVMLFLVDLVEIGSKPCIERMISCQIAEKLVGLEKIGGELSGTVSRFLKALNLCKNLSGTERMVMKQQVVRKVRAAARGHAIEGSLVELAESCLSDSWGGASSSRRKK